LIILSDAGNIFDALFLTARAALCDTKVPRTRSVGYRASGRNEAEPKAKSSGGIMGSAVKGGDMDVDDDDLTSSFDPRLLQPATDFELEDYWDEGDVLDGRSRWPLCITLNIVSIIKI
jgi:exosome complex component RRP42